MSAEPPAHRLPAPVAFHEWIASVRHELKPPVGNKLLFGNGLQKVMVVGGPNVRRDYHIEAGEELFFQLEGDMCLEVYERGVPRSVPIMEGEIFLLPGRIPHSPQRSAGTVGLVLERDRLPGELDGLRWYTDDHSSVLYEETFHCTNLGTQLKPVIDRYFSSASHASGVPPPGAQYDRSSIAPMPGSPEERLATPRLHLDEVRTLDAPVPLRAWAGRHSGQNVVLYGHGAVGRGARAESEYRVEVKQGPDAEWEGGGRVITDGAALRAQGVAGSTLPPCLSELFLYQVEGTAEVEVEVRGDAAHPHPHPTGASFTMGPGSVLLVPPGHAVKVRWAPGCLALAVTNAAGLR